MLIKHSNTSNIIRFTLKNSSTGIGLTGLTNASAGLIIATICNNEATTTVYTQAASNIETIAALGTYAAPTANKCRFKEVDATNHKGLYEFQFANARFTIASARSMAISVTGAASLLDADYEIQLVSFDPHDSVRMGLTAMPNAAADGAGGLPISDAGGLDLDTKLANAHEITAARMGALTDWINGGRLDLLLDAIPTTAMRGTDNAALASVLGALNDAASDGDPTAADTLMKYIKQLINILVGTAGIVAFPAEAGPANAISLAEVIRAIHADVTGLNGSVMVGTDGANTTVPDVAGTAATLHATTDGKIDTNKTELDGLQGTDGKALVSTDAQDLSGTLDVNAKTATATALDLILKDSTFALAMADAIWDEILAGATHNIATSAGRRVRETGAFAIESGTAQAGASISITLAATADFGDGVFNRNLIVLTGNTGKGQTRTIVDCDAASKVITVDREWRVIPDDTTEYQITPDDTPLTVDHGVARGGTSTTITIREYASSSDNAYWCNIVAIIAGKGRGQARLVGSYDGTSKIITICGENWIEIPDTTSVYAMMPYGTTCTSCLSTSALALINTEIDNALDTAIPGSPTDDSINQRIKALPSGIAKNVALSSFTFFMVLASDHVTAATGKTITGQISKDGGAFAGLTNSITEISNGLYKVDITQAEMNADVITLKFTETDCDQRIVVIYTT